MSTFDQLRHGMNRAWDSLAEGWRQLRESASHAMTRFQPAQKRKEVQTPEDRHALMGTRWSVLAAEVSETEQAVVVRLEVPGMESGDFELSVLDGRALSVTGEKQAQREESRGQYHIMECAYGRFQRIVPLPVEVAESGARANYAKGVLRVELPKLAQQPRRRIEVESD